MTKNINKQSTQTQLSLLSLVGVIALTGCNSMPNPFNNSSKAPAPRMESVMHDGQAQSGMKPAFGVNTSNLFSEKIRSDSGRLDRLENAVQGISNEFNAVRPAIDRLVAIEEDVQTLIGQLEAIAQSSSPTAPTAAIAPQATPKAHVPVATKTKKAQKTPTPEANGNLDIYGLRLGEHSNKTRLVLDVNAPVAFNVELDNNESILVIDIQKANWTAEKKKTFKNSPLVSSYSVEQGENGVMLIAQLKKTARIAYKDSIKALNGNGRRIVIDLAN